MLRPLCIFTDLDGTLFGADSEMSERTIRALQAADAAGVLVVAATGRSHRTTTHRLAPARVLRWALCSNGAVRFDLSAGAPTEVTTIHRESIAAVVMAARAALPDVGFGWETIDGFGFEGEFAHPPGDVLQNPGPRTGPQDLADVEEAIKLYISHPVLTDVALQRALAPHLPTSVDAATSGAPFIEATAITATKGAAAAALAEDLGFEASDTAAIGDQMNDRSLLLWTGHAIAMGNAHPDILELADEVTARNTDDGAAAAIERLIALPR